MLKLAEDSELQFLIDVMMISGIKPYSKFYFVRNLPYEQSSADVDPAAESIPSGQLVQEEAPSPLKVFSPHC